MKNFNLLVSSSRYNEKNVKAELWFTLLVCGDQYPIISDLEFSGLVTAYTHLNQKKVISKIRKILKVNPSFFQYILKIVPIDFVCENDVQTIAQIVNIHYQEFINKNQSFKIELKRRKNDLIERERFTNTIAKIIDNKVDLQTPDVIVRFEILGNLCGIAFLLSENILKIRDFDQI